MLAKERKLMALRGKLPSDGMALNIGCGDFNYFSSIKGFSGKVINCDKDFSPVTPFIRCFGEKLPFKDNSFDHVIALDVIEHIKDDALFLNEILRVLKKRGKLFITTPCSEDDFLLIEIPKKVNWGNAEKEWGHVRRGYTRNEFRALTGNHFEISYLERFGATFSRIGYQLYYLRHWYKFWRYIPPVRWFLRMFNYLDVLFCNGKGHMIFAVLNPRK